MVMLDVYPFLILFSSLLLALYFLAQFSSLLFYFLAISLARIRIHNNRSGFQYIFFFRNILILLYTFIPNSDFIFIIFKPMKIHLFEKHVILLNVIQSLSLDIDKNQTHVSKFSGRNFATSSIYFETIKFYIRFQKSINFQNTHKLKSLYSWEFILFSLKSK